jgi:hypothetical protein
MGAHGSRRFRIQRGAIDQFVSEAIIEKMEKPGAARLLTRPKKRTQRNAAALREVARLRNEIAIAEAELDQPEDAAAIRELARGIGGLRRQLADVSAQLENDVNTESSPLDGFAGRPDARRLWAGFGLDRKRDIVRRLLSVTIYRPPVHGNQYHPVSPDTCVGLEWLR